MKSATSTTVQRWEHFRHEADIGVRGLGPTKEAAFEQAALAVTAVMTDPRLVEPWMKLSIVCEAPDDELLLADWLNAIIYETAHRKLIFSRFEVHINGRQLSADIWGEPVDVVRHEPAVEIKGATYTELRVGPTGDGGWIAQCVVDV